LEKVAASFPSEVPQHFVHVLFYLLYIVSLFFNVQLMLLLKLLLLALLTLLL